jgi:hypothetical protein
MGKKNKKKSVAFIINNQPIPGSFWGKLIKYTGDKYQAALFIFRARQAENIIKFIQAGIKKSDPYILKASREEFDNSTYARAWIDEYIFKIKPPKIETVKLKTQPKAISDILNSILPKGFNP